MAKSKSPLPKLYHPQLATLVKMVPEGDAWLHEIKYDGYRIGCLINRGTVTLTSRNAKDWTANFPEIRDAAKQLGVNQALFDGEVAIVLGDGRTSFQALQNAFGGGSRAGLVYFAFDLLHLDGSDLSRAPLEDRKTALRHVLENQKPTARIRYSDHVVGDGPAMLQHACRMGLEGVISKRRDLPHQPGRTNSWLKTKCIARQEFVIGGFTDPEGSREGIGALLIGFYDKNRKLIFAGKVGTGFTQKAARELRKRLDRLEQHICPFATRPAGPLGRNAHWVRPELVAEVAFSEWTGEGRIRHPSLQGLREDKRPEEVTLEKPQRRGAG